MLPECLHFWCLVSKKLFQNGQWIYILFKKISPQKGATKLATSFSPFCEKAKKKKINCRIIKFIVLILHVKWLPNLSNFVLFWQPNTKFVLEMYFLCHKYNHPNSKIDVIFLLQIQHATFAMSEICYVSSYSKPNGPKFL